MNRTILNNFKGWVTGILFLLLIFAFPALGSLAAPSAADCDIDYKNEIVYVKKGSNSDLYFAIVDKGKTPKDYLQVLPQSTAQHVFGAGSPVAAFTIDLSAIDFKKEKQLLLKNTDSETATTIDFAVAKTLKVEFSGIEKEAGDRNTLYPAAKFPKITEETGYFYFKLDDSYISTSLAGKVEYHAGSSANYRPLEELDLRLYMDRGTTIYFRVCEDGQPLTKEVKYKVKKMANAPSVKVDGSKMSVSLKDTMEYRFVTNNTPSAWVKCTEKKGMLLKDMNMPGGNGNTTAYSTTTLQVRVAATEKAIASKTNSVLLTAVASPKEGNDGIVVTAVNANDPKKGLSIKNNAEEDYQYAVVEKTAGKTNSQIINALDGTAKKGQAGFVSWKNVKAGAKAVISYSSYKDFDEYLVLYRKAPIKEDNKTAEVEFRTASVIKVYGGAVPTCDSEGGGIMIEGAATSGSKVITYTYDSDVDLYTSINNAAYTKNTTGKVTVSGNVGDTVIVKAYTKNANNEESEVVTLNFRFVKSGELDVYKNKWGYYLCKKADAEAGTNSRQLLYQRVYLAYSTYEETVDYSDLTGLTREDLSLAILSARTDNPELIQAKGGYSYTNATINLKYNDRATAERLLGQCNDALEVIKQKISTVYGAGATKMQKVQVIHDYLVLNKEYQSSAYDQTMAGALSDEFTPVCMSYTLAMKYCCDKLGIQCEVIYGNAGSGSKKEGHAWNIINYGDTVNYATAQASDYVASNWYEMDVTWDDPIGPGTDYIGYSYFNVTTEKMNASRERTYHVYPSYPVDNCTGTAYSYDNIKNTFQSVTFK